MKLSRRLKSFFLIEYPKETASKTSKNKGKEQKMQEEKGNTKEKQNKQENRTATKKKGCERPRRGRHETKA